MIKEKAITRILDELLDRKITFDEAKRKLLVLHGEYGGKRKIIACEDPMVCLRGCSVLEQTCENPIYEF